MTIVPNGTVKILLLCILLLCALVIYLFSSTIQTAGKIQFKLTNSKDNAKTITQDEQTNINTGKAKLDTKIITQDDTKIITEDERTLAKLLEQSYSSSTGLTEVEKKCPMYQEFRRLDFLHPALRHQLCTNFEAYKKYPDGYPICKLRAPFNEDMLNVVRRGSDVVGLLDMQNIRIPMFVYKGNDYISNLIRAHGAWEPEFVHWIMRFALKLPDVTFVDIGSNIGVYSLQAAKLGLPVVSLDANIRNLLRLRLSLNAASRDATLVWNFVAPDQTLKYLSFWADCNVGGAGRDKWEKSDLPDTVPVMPFRSERIGQFIKTKNVVMKMDIQGAEAQFLSFSGRMFTDFNIPAVQMEWFPPMIHGNESLIITKFFTDRGYQVWKLPRFEPLNVNDVAKWGVCDVMWIHKNYISMM